MTDRGTVRLQLLGAFAAFSGAEEVTAAIAQPKRLALLIWLELSRPRGLHSRDTLCGLLWPESPNDKARAALRQLLLVLRRDLGVDIFVSEGELVGINADRVTSDVGAVLDALERGDDPGVVAAFGGELLPGLPFAEGDHFERWLEQRRSDLRRAVVQASWREVERAESRGDFVEALRLAEWAISTDQEDEPGLRRVMTLQAQHGDRTAALRGYRRYAERLRQDWDAEPEEPTRLLYERIKEGDLAPGPGDSALRGGAAHRQPEAHPESGPSLPMQVRRYKWGLLAGGAVTLLLLSVLGWRLTHRLPRPAVAAAETEISVAVLTFALLTEDSSQAYLAQGLSEDVSTALNGVTGLRVKAPSAVRRVQNAYTEDLKSLGKVLEVRYLVDGSIRPAGEKLRVSVRLVSPETEESRWAASYDRLAAGMLDLPLEIAKSVATVLAGGERTASAASLSRRLTTNPEAYDAYLRGNFHFSLRSESAVKLALADYQRALTLDPAFHAARARIAMCYGQMADYEWLPSGMTREGVAALGLALAEMAVRQDSTSADAWVAIGYLVGTQHTVDGRRKVEALRTAINLDRYHVEAHIRLAWAMVFSGDFEAATEGMRRVLALDPGFYVAYRGFARIAALQGDLVKARALLDTAIAMAPQSGPAVADRATVSLLLGDLGSADRDLEHVARLGWSPIDNWLIPMLEGANGNPSAVRAWLRAHPLVWPEQRAGLLYSIGDREEAFRTLEQGGVRTDRLTHAVTWGPLRSEPRFKAVVKSARKRDGYDMVAR